MATGIGREHQEKRDTNILGYDVGGVHCGCIETGLVCLLAVSLFESVYK